jgi:predicted RNA-binding protein with PIN domain
MSGSAPSALLLVDGYNVLGAWAELRQIRSSRKRDRHVHQGLEESRRHLTEQLANYSALQGYQTQLVFDAQYRDTPSNQEVITANLLIHFTEFGQTADTFIEKTCATLRHEVQYRRQRLIVATSDRAQQLTVVGYGAEWMSAEGLLADIDLVIQRVRHKQPTKRPAGRLLAHSLDPEAQKRLSDLRFGK